MVMMKRSLLLLWCLATEATTGAARTQKATTTATEVSASGTTKNVKDYENDTTLKSSRVVIHIPTDLYHSLGEEHIQADFGFVGNNQHDGSISGPVYWTDENLCLPTTAIGGGGSPPTPTIPPTTTPPTTLPPSNNGSVVIVGEEDDSRRPIIDAAASMEKPEHPFILMTGLSSTASSTNDCSFVTKARNAQLYYGASAFIIGANGTATSKSTIHRLTDDGSGSDVTIPTFFLSKIEFTNQIRTELVTKKQPVLIELTWGLPIIDRHDTKSKAIHIDLFTTARDPLMNIYTYETLKYLIQKDAGHLPEANITFTPHYLIFDGTKFNCHPKRGHLNQDDLSNTTTGPCDELCTNYGRYCAIPDAGLTGKEIVEETLRRLCVFKHYNNSNLWWDYNMEHLKHCSNPNQYSDPACISKAYKVDSSSGGGSISEETVNDCMTDSGGLYEDATNFLLQAQLFPSSGQQPIITSIPTLTLNDQVVNDAASIAPWNLLDAICKQYWYNRDENIPKICMECSTCPNIIACYANDGKCMPFVNNNDADDSGNGDKKKHKKHRARTFFITTFVLSIVGSVGWIAFKVRRGDDVTITIPFLGTVGSFGGGGGGYGGSPNNGNLNEYFSLPSSME